MLTNAYAIQPPFLRYPGGKRRMLCFLSHYLPTNQEIIGHYIEPFIGGGSVFFHTRPHRATLSDVNPELIQLYRAIQHDWESVWKEYCAMPASKEAYRMIRAWPTAQLDLPIAAARLLYLNRTCFKGMWRHNANGQFNVGYGGEARRWVITEDTLRQVSMCLQRATLILSDFEPIIDSAKSGDFIFLDPPYKPGAREIAAGHYVAQRFSFMAHSRLSHALQRASARGVQWMLTTSSHEDIVALFPDHTVIAATQGTGVGIGQTGKLPNEVLIYWKGCK